MAQSNIVLAFRKRMKMHGYSNISIKRSDIDSAFPAYVVTASVPVFECHCMRIITELEMKRLLNCV